jgi:hypothetical protein
MSGACHEVAGGLEDQARSPRPEQTTTGMPESPNQP